MLWGAVEVWGALKTCASFTAGSAWALGSLPILKSVWVGPWGSQSSWCCGWDGDPEGTWLSRAQHSNRHSES